MMIPYNSPFGSGAEVQQAVSRPEVAAFPRQMLDRLPPEEAAVWVQFAEAASALPQAFQVLAEAFLALSWELEAFHTRRKVEDWLAQQDVETAVRWADMTVNEYRNAIKGWDDVAVALAPETAFAQWRGYALERAGQLHAMKEQVCTWGLALCEQFQLPVPEAMQRWALSQRRLRAGR